MPLAYATDCDLADLIEMSDYGECDKESDKEGSEKDSEKEDTKLASPYSSPSTGLPYYVTLAALMKLDESEPYLRICSPPPEA